MQGAIAVAQKYTDVAEVVAKNRIHVPIAVEVSGCYRRGNKLKRRSNRILQRSVAVAQQHANVVTRPELSGDEHVKLVVVVEIGNRQPFGPGERAVIAGWPKRAIAISQKHADVRQIYHNNIRLAIAIEVADRNKQAGVGGIGNHGRRPKRSVTVAQIDAHGRRSILIGGDDIQVPVAVKVRHRQRIG